jgi:DNA invertase Pin-like site-specific DNA recombinase/peptidoglycan hydrolase-like protein with peptidoglycan-binding domain
VRVRRVQRILARRGFDLGPPGVDGRFGPLTAGAVRRMQDKYGLSADGAVGPKTRRVLKRLDASRPTQRPARSPAKPAQPQQQNQSAGQRPTPASPATQPRPATPAQTAQPPADPASRMTLPVILSILAAVIATAPLAVARLRRKRPASAPEPDPVDREALPERSSDEGDVSSYRGPALAAAVPPGGGDESRRTGDPMDEELESAPAWVPGGDARRSRPELPDGARVIGYVTASPDTAREHDAFAQIEALCEQEGWELVEIIRDQDRSRMPDRPGLSRALEQIAGGDAQALVVTDTRRLIDSLGDLAALIEWFRNADAALVAVDLDLDTSTTEGHRTANTVMRVAGWESERRTGRAWSGLVEVENRESASGPTSDDRVELFQRIDAMGAEGRSLQAIADELNHEGVPPLQGRTWRPFDVESALANAAVTRRLRYELPSLRREEGG